MIILNPCKAPIHPISCLNSPFEPKYQSHYDCNPQTNFTIFVSPFNLVKVNNYNFEKEHQNISIKFKIINLHSSIFILFKITSIKNSYYSFIKILNNKYILTQNTKKYHNQILIWNTKIITFLLLE